MPIITQDIIDRVRQALDAEESTVSPQLGYYDDLKDIIPNINNAIQWLVATVNSFLEEKKFSSELFRELTFVRMFQTSINSRIALDLSSINHEIWTILAVYPEPVYTPANSAILNVIAPNSVFRGDVSFISSQQSAKRLTIGEWNKNARDPFEDGNTIFTNSNAPSLIAYGYLNAADYTSSNYQLLSIPQEIEIRPALSKKFCGVAYIKTPTKAAIGADPLEFPQSASNLIYEKALNLIATKIGDKTTVATKTDEELTQQLKAIV